MYILGAGMAGCVAAILNPKAVILEGALGPPDNHSAVLRFRTPKIAQITGLEFRKVLVRKAIWYERSLYGHCTPLLGNLYSRKVSGQIIPRSIWNLEPVERFVAHPDFHMELLGMLEKRIEYDRRVVLIRQDSLSMLDGSTLNRVGVPILSTMPMNILAQATGIELPATLSHAPIFTQRWAVDGCDVHQTVYFPGNETNMYRATLTGGDLILEGVGGDFDYTPAMDALGLEYSQLAFRKSASQKYGKIVPIDESVRKNFMFEATQQLAVYSLGRFACWRNILLDDVYDDVFKIRRMLTQHHYDIRKELQ